MTVSRRVSRLALWSIFVALLVMGIKFAAWWLTGSAALFSDALESIVNVIAALIALIAIRISNKPADENHQYGHQKAEYFSAVIEGVLVVLAALLIFHSAWQALTLSHIIDQPAIGMAVNALAMGINFVWARLLISTGESERSPALLADGKHIMTDVVTSVGVLAGLAVTVATGWLVLDAIMAFIVGVNVLYEGWRVISSSVGGLMDAALDADEVEAIEQAILENAAGAIEIHDLKTRKSGPVCFVEFHLVVDGTMSVEKSHRICDRIEAGIKTFLPRAKSTIHVEPDYKSKQSGINIPKT